MWPLMFAFFHLAQVFKCHPCSIHHYFIPFNRWIIFHCMDIRSLSIHQLRDIWVLFAFRLLKIVVQWTFMYKFLCRFIFSFLMAIYLDLGLLGHIVTLVFWGTVRLFSKIAALFCIPNRNIWGLQYLHSLSNTWYCLSFYYRHPVGCGTTSFWCICISLVINDLKYLTCAAYVSFF